MAETSKTSNRRSADAVPDGHRRVRILYSPDGFRGVKDVPDDLAAILVDESRAAYVDESTPLGEDEPPAGEFQFPATSSSVRAAVAGGGDRADAPESAPPSPATSPATPTTAAAK